MSLDLDNESLNAKFKDILNNDKGNIYESIKKLKKSISELETAIKKGGINRLSNYAKLNREKQILQNLFERKEEGRIKINFGDETFKIKESYLKRLKNPALYFQKKYLKKSVKNIESFNVKNEFEAKQLDRKLRFYYKTAKNLGELNGVALVSGLEKLEGFVLNNISKYKFTKELSKLYNYYISDSENINMFAEFGNIEEFEEYESTVTDKSFDETLSTINFEMF